MLRDHCYYSLDYNDDIKRYANPHKLAEVSRTIQFPFVPLENTERPEELAAKMLEKKREQGRRLQAQAAAVRLEKVGVSSMSDKDDSDQSRLTHDVAPPAHPKGARPASISRAARVEGKGEEGRFHRKSDYMTPTLHRTKQR